jgi:hypothetical protein
MADIDRKMIANYFKPFPAWTVLCIFLGVIVGIAGILVHVGLIAVAAILVVIGIVGLTALRKPSDQQMDQWWQQELESLKKKALSKVGFDSADCIADPVSVWGPRVENTGGVPLQLKKGSDGIVRFNPVDVSIINFGEHQLVGYQTSYDRFTGNPLQEETNEYFYKDVVSVTTKTDTTSRDVIVGKEKRRVQLKNSETFRLTTSGGTEITVFLRDEALLEEVKQAKGGTLPTTQAEQAVASVRRMLRDKKVSS